MEKVIEKVVEPEKKYQDGYDESLAKYLSEQIQKKLDDMKSSQVISESKYSKIKEKI